MFWVSVQLIRKKNAEGAFLKMFMGDEAMAGNYGSTLLLVDNPASFGEEKDCVIDSWRAWSETVPAARQDWDRWIPVVAPKDPREAATVASKLIRSLKTSTDGLKSQKPNAIRLVKALARILGGPWAEEARKVWGIKTGTSTGTSSGPSDGPRQADAPRKPDPSTDPCAVCGVRPRPGSKHKLCGGCKAVLYCSKECQVKHWKEGGHKSECSRVHM